MNGASVTQLEHVDEDNRKSKQSNAPITDVNPRKQFGTLEDALNHQPQLSEHQTQVVKVIL